MNYYVVYDKDDNIIALCDDLDELSKFVNRRKKELKYRFKDRDMYYIQVPNLLKIYKFSWGEKNEKQKRLHILHIYCNYVILIVLFV